MPSAKKAAQEEENLYKTTFHREIKYEVGEFISARFLFGIIDAIAERVKIKQNEIQTEFSLDDNSSIRVSGKSNVEKLLKDSQKYGRRVSSIEIDSGIIYASNDKSAHFSLSFRLHRAENYLNTGIRAYAVANDRTNSQLVIDWGNGTLKDFQNLSLLEQTPQKHELIIKLYDGSVAEWSVSDSIQKVQVVNEVKTAPSKLSDKANLIAVAAIIIAVSLAVIGWLFFR